MTRPTCACCMVTPTVHHCHSCFRNSNSTIPVCLSCSTLNGSADYWNMLCNRCGKEEKSSLIAASHSPGTSLDTATETTEVSNTPATDTPIAASNPLQAFTEVASRLDRVPESSSTIVVTTPQNSNVVSVP